MGTSDQADPPDQPENSDKQDLFRMIRQSGVYMAIPMCLAGGPTLGFFVGKYFDQRFGTDPIGLITAIVIGLIAGIIEAIRIVRYAQRIS